MTCTIYAGIADVGLPGMSPGTRLGIVVRPQLPILYQSSTEKTYYPWDVQEHPDSIVFPYPPPQQKMEHASSLLSEYHTIFPVFQNPFSTRVWRRLVSSAPVRRESICINNRIYISLRQDDMWVGCGWTTRNIMLPSCPISTFPDLIEHHVGIGQQDVYEALQKRLLVPAIQRLGCWRTRRLYQLTSGTIVPGSNWEYDETNMLTVAAEMPGYSIADCIRMTLQIHTSWQPSVVCSNKHAPGEFTRHLSYEYDSVNIPSFFMVRANRIGNPYMPIYPSDHLVLQAAPNITYHLMGILVKTGPATHGHWTARVRTTGGQWYFMDTEYMRLLTETDISNECQGTVFFYDQSTTWHGPVTPLANPSGTRCYANAVSNVLVHIPSIPQFIGVHGRCPTHTDLSAIIAHDI